MDGDPSHRAAGVREGDVIAGKYRVDAILGVGGMGVVVAGHHVQLDTRVAIKFLLPAMLANLEAVARFTREARAAVKITNEHVARVTDVGTLDCGSPYMVMEFLDGADLGLMLERQGPLSFEEAVDFVLQAGEAIAEAHALGIVHRDLKPANLFCIRGADGRQTIKVLDFGISKVTGLTASAQNASLTQGSAVMGSPLYMSPEQIEASAGVDARADIWALGVVLHELLTGKAPFVGENIAELLLKITQHPPAALRDHWPDAPDGLGEVIAKCLSKDREGRYRNVAELAIALRRFAPERARASVQKIVGIIQSAGLGTSAMSAPSPDRAMAQPGPGATAPPAQTSNARPTARTKAVAGVLAAGALLVVGGAVGLGLFGQGAPAAARTIPSATAPATVGVDPSPALAPLAPEQAVSSAAPNVSPLPATANTGQAMAKNTTGARRPTAAATPSPGTTTTPASLHATSSPRPDCDPNYDLDARGEKRFKPYCFGLPAHASHVP